MCSVNLGLSGVYKYKSSHKDHLNKSCCCSVQGLALVTLGIPKILQSLYLAGRGEKAM